MSKRSQEKRKARGKEKAKAARRAKGMSAFSRLVGDVDAVECWMMRRADDPRMVNIAVFRGVRGEGYAGAFFLVDYDCIGLKDAFYQVGVLPSEVVRRYREEGRMSGTEVLRVDAGKVREIVGGALKWTRKHAFRVPVDMERCLKILGGVVDAAGADVSEFGTAEGGLNYVGALGDLRKRLTVETVEEFMKREGVSCTFMDREEIWEEDKEMVEGEDEEEMEKLDAIYEDLTRGIWRGARKWLKGQGREAHGMLKEAARLRAFAIMRAIGEGKDEQMRVSVDRNGEAMLGEIEGAGEQREMRAAYGQVMEYVLWLQEEADAGSEVEEEEFEEGDG